MGLERILLVWIFNDLFSFVARGSEFFCLFEPCGLAALLERATQLVVGGCVFFGCYVMQPVIFEQCYLQQEQLSVSISVVPQMVKMISWP